jgi:hypothetical protein
MSLIIKNGGFESDLQDWDTSRGGDPNATVETLINTVDPYAGLKSLKIRITTPTSPAGIFLRQTLPASLFPPGAEFQLSYAHRGFGDNSAELDFMSGGNAVQEFVNYGIPTRTVWTPYQDPYVKGTVPSATFDSVRLMFGVRAYVGSDADFDLDEVTITIAGLNYTLTIQVVGSGSTNPLPGAYSVISGSVVEVTASPAKGWKFDNWDLNGAVYTQNPISVQVTGDAILTAVFSEAPIPPPPIVSPGPGDTKKYLSLRWDWYGFGSYNRDVNTYLPIVIEKLHPKVIQFRIGDFWYPSGDWPYWNPSRYAVMRQAVADVARICAQNNVVLMLCLTNSENGDLGIGPDFYNPTVFAEGYVAPNGYVVPAGCPTYQQALVDFLEATEPYPPMWFCIDTEVTKPSPTETGDVLRRHVQQLIDICASYGTHFAIHKIYLSRGFEILQNELPWGLDTNYPWQGGASDGVDFIRGIDTIPYGFMMKIGILRNDVYPYWTEETILNIFNTVDQTQKCVLPFLDLTQEMLDPTLCPDFVPVVTREVAARGYITSLTPVPPPTPISPLLTIHSTPIVGVTFYLDSATYVTPFSENIAQGTYIVKMPANVLVGTDNYVFKSWEDGSTSSERAIDLVSDMTLVATYELPPPPPPRMGVLDIHAYQRFVEVVADVVVVETGESYKTPVPITLTEGTYNLTAQYMGETQTQPQTVEPDITKKVEFHFAPIEKRLQAIRDRLPRVFSLVDRVSQKSLIKGLIYSRVKRRG